MPSDSSIAAAPFCSICCEDKKTRLYRLSKCSCYSSCKDCLAKWVQKEESSGMTSPTCPFCRLPLAEEDACQILGRAFEPRTTIMRVVEEEEVDDLTQQWLDQHTQCCPSCHSRIQKASSQDCDLMECLCGYRFCFSCGESECRCHRDDEAVDNDDDVANHGYWDNVLQRYSDRSMPSTVAPADVETGVVDLKRHIQIRKEEEQARRSEERKRRQSLARSKYTCIAKVNDNSSDEEEEEEFVRFTQVLLRYLERNDPQMHINAKNVLRFLKNKNKGLDAIRSSLYLTVGERYWTRAQFYFTRLYQQATNGDATDQQNHDPAMLYSVHTRQQQQHQQQRQHLPLDASAALVPQQSYSYQTFLPPPRPLSAQQQQPVRWALPYGIPLQPQSPETYFTSANYYALGIPPRSFLPPR